MQRSLWIVWIGAVIGTLGLAVMEGWAQPAKPQLERLRIAVAPLGFDSNFSWSHTISGLLDKRPALACLVGVDRHTGAFIPELAETWSMAPDGKTWTVTLRQGITFHATWGECTAEEPCCASRSRKPRPVQRVSGAR